MESILRTDAGHPFLGLTRQLRFRASVEQLPSHLVHTIVGAWPHQNLPAMLSSDGSCLPAPEHV